MSHQNAAEVALPSYTDFKRNSSKHRKELKHASVKDIRNYLFSVLNTDIPEYWTGTPWSFNGTTRVPQHGSIACGCFVTNTLSDLGFNIQRIKLAQMASSQMINTLCVNVKTLKGMDQLKEYLKTQPAKSVFIVGLDFHTGYIIKDEKAAYFLHSNYISAKGVMKENIETSHALANSKAYVIGSLTENTPELKAWVNY
jgi:hypothetical protein